MINLVRVAAGEILLTMTIISSVAPKQLNRRATVSLHRPQLPTATAETVARSPRFSIWIWTWSWMEEEEERVGVGVAVVALVEQFRRRVPSRRKR